MALTLRGWRGRDEVEGNVGRQGRGMEEEAWGILGKKRPVDIILA
jgi:hypothetical protein